MTSTSANNMDDGRKGCKTWKRDRRFGIALAAAQLDPSTMDQHDFGPHERLLWLELACCCSWSGPNLWRTMYGVSVATLVTRTKLSRSSIKRSLGKLIGSGLVQKIKNSPGGVCHYRLHVVERESAVPTGQSLSAECELVDAGADARSDSLGQDEPRGGSQRPTPWLTGDPRVVHGGPPYQEDRRSRSISHTGRVSKASDFVKELHRTPSGRRPADHSTIAFTAEELATHALGQGRGYDAAIARDAALAFMRLAQALPGRRCTIEQAAPIRVEFDRIIRAAPTPELADIALTETIARVAREHDAGYFPSAKTVAKAAAPELERLHAEARRRSQQ